jgi:hypothetical protein
MIVLPAMPPEQTASWLGLLDLHERLAEGWTLTGGQLVHLHCAEQHRRLRQGQDPGGGDGSIPRGSRPRRDVRLRFDVIVRYRVALLERV